MQVQYPGEHLIELAQDLNYVHSQQQAVVVFLAVTFPHVRHYYSC